MSFHRIVLSSCAALLIVLAGREANAVPLSFAQQVIADGPLAFWQLNDANKSNGATAVSSVNPGTYNGAYQWGNQTGNSVTSIPAAFPGMGTAADFHNTTLNTSLAGSDAVVSPNTGLPIGSTDRTVILWAQTNTPLDGQYHVASEYGTTGMPLNRGFATAVFANFDSNSPNGGMAVTQYGNGVGSTTAVNDGNWHFFAVTVSGGGTTPTYDVYFDGVLQNTKNMDTNTVLGLASYIGAAGSIDGVGEIGWNGGLGDMAVFNYALSGAQISTLFASAPVPEPASLVLFGLGAAGVAVAAYRRRKV